MGSSQIQTPAMNFAQFMTGTQNDLLKVFGKTKWLEVIGNLPETSTSTAGVVNEELKEPRDVLTQIRIDGIKEAFRRFVQAIEAVFGDQSARDNTWKPAILNTLNHTLVLYSDRAKKATSAETDSILDFLNELTATIELPWAAMALASSASVTSTGISETLLQMYKQILFGLSSVIRLLEADPQSNMWVDSIRECRAILPCLRTHSKKIKLGSLFSEISKLNGTN